MTGTRRLGISFAGAVFVVLGLTTITPAPGRAQLGGGRQGRGPALPPSLPAVPLDGAEPRIDGQPNEPVWLTGALAEGFTQFEPLEGQPATERTEVRVLYGRDALYVAFWAYDSDPEAIVAPLSRRDQGNYTDRVHLVVDSYFDRRTAFHFAVNPAGARFDAYRFEDTREDASWDAVWDVAARRTEFGWTAEFRIPFSQLRFGDDPVQDWGIQFARDVARKSELSLWAPLSRNTSGMVSRFGTLEGLRDLHSPRRLELLPYALERAERAPGEAADPFHQATALETRVGGDLKYGITGNLTLDMTLNPDFGQVEADPAQFNLSAFEVFLPERRPFFLEGANIFTFGLNLGDGGPSESLFYSRRIGRSPQGHPADGVDDAEYWEGPDFTSILGAAKVSGKTAGGLSVGMLYSLTHRETGSAFTSHGDIHRTVVEPLTNYGVVRLQQDFREGQSAIGVIGTAVGRDPTDAQELGLRTSAYTGGMDFRHRFWENNWALSGYLVGSHVHGNAESMDRTQRSSARFFQRPDNDHTTYDPDRTTLTGWSANAYFGKEGGSNWRFGVGGQARSPGFEPNDVGFMQTTDQIESFLFVGYDKARGSRRFNRWRVNSNVWRAWNFGGDDLGVGGNVNGSVQFRNFWSAYGGVAFNAQSLDTRLLRGGPAFVTEPGANGWMGVNTDSRKPVNLGLHANWAVRPESDSWRWNLDPGVTWRPSARATLRAGWFLARNVEDRQWVTRAEGSGDGQDHYTFGRLDQTTTGLTARVDYSFSPDLSLQVYLSPFLSSGAYRDYRKVTAPRASRYEDRFGTLAYGENADGEIEADVDGDGIAENLGNPNFNFQQFNSNVVLRWEYRPGSTLFLVWSQARDHFDRTGRFDLGNDAGDLFAATPTNVFMVKVTYWLNP